MNNDVEDAYDPFGDNEDDYTSREDITNIVYLIVEAY